MTEDQSFRSFKSHKFLANFFLFKGRWYKIKNSSWQKIQDLEERLGKDAEEPFKSTFNMLCVAGN